MKIYSTIASIALACMIFFSCGDTQKAEHVNGNIYFTPDGYVVIIPDSLFIHGLYLHDRTITDFSEIEFIIKEWLDEEMSEWVEVHGDRKSLHEATYTIHDHWFFKVNGDMCAGYILRNHIDVALYHKYEGIDKPIMNYASHALIWHKDDQEHGTWKWYAGNIPENGRGLPAIQHELGHLYYGEKYGH